MRKINKNLADVPSSLNSKKTKEKRQEIIDNKKYPSKKTINEFSKSQTYYDEAYKESDIKKILSEKLYNSKCAFCESKIEQFHIEHFRPKSIYYCLAYSWDNLLFCCPNCNTSKSTKFKVSKRANINDIQIDNIHQLGEKYDAFENNVLINPEKEDFTNEIVFDKQGHISSKNERVNYTIETCNLDRIWLNDERKLVYEEFEQMLTSLKINKQIINNTVLKKLLTIFLNEKQTYLTFRKYIVKYYLKQIF